MEEFNVGDFCKTKSNALLLDGIGIVGIIDSERVDRYGKILSVKILYKGIIPYEHSMYKNIYTKAYGDCIINFRDWSLKRIKDADKYVKRNNSKMSKLIPNSPFKSDMFLKGKWWHNGISCCMWNSV